MGALNNGRSGSKFMTKTNLTANSSVTSIAPTGKRTKLSTQGRTYANHIGIVTKRLIPQFL